MTGSSLALLSGSSAFFLLAAAGAPAGLDFKYESRAGCGLLVLDLNIDSNKEGVVDAGAGASAASDGATAVAATAADVLAPAAIGAAATAFGDDATGDDADGAATEVPGAAAEVVWSVTCSSVDAAGTAIALNMSSRYLRTPSSVSSIGAAAAATDNAASELAAAAGAAAASMLVEAARAAVADDAPAVAEDGTEPAFPLSAAVVAAAGGEHEWADGTPAPNGRSVD